MITRKDVAGHLEHQAKANFLVGMKNYTPLRGAFAMEEPSDGAFETYVDLGAAPWPVQNAGKAGPSGNDGRTGHPNVNSINEGGQLTFVGTEEQGLTVFNLDYEVAFSVHHNAINDDRVGGIERWARQAGMNFEKHSDYLCFDALNQGGSSTSPYGLGYDGLSFFNDSHIDPGAEYQTAQDNNFALTLNLDNFETVAVAAGKFKDNRGQPVGLNHNLLIVPKDLQRVGRQITGNPNAYDTANNEVNPYSGEVDLLVAPGGWLDTTAWVLVDGSQPEKPLILQERQAPQMVIVDDEDNNVRKYIIRARKAVAYADWRLAALGNT